MRIGRGKEMGYLECLAFRDCYGGRVGKKFEAERESGSTGFYRRQGLTSKKGRRHL